MQIGDVEGASNGDSWDEWENEIAREKLENAGFAVEMGANGATSGERKSATFAADKGENGERESENVDKSEAKPLTKEEVDKLTDLLVKYGFNGKTFMQKVEQQKFKNPLIAELARELLEKYATSRTAAKAKAGGIQGCERELWCAVDSFEVQGVWFLHLITLDSRYSKVKAVADGKRPTAEDAKIFIRSCSFEGVIKPKMIMDDGSEFVNKKVANLLRQLSIKGYVVPARAHWRNGVIERRHHMFRRVIRRYLNLHAGEVMSQQEVELLVERCVYVCNSTRLDVLFGLSPFEAQWARVPILENSDTPGLELGLNLRLLVQEVQREVDFETQLNKLQELDKVKQYKKGEQIEVVDRDARCTYTTTLLFQDGSTLFLRKQNGQTIDRAVQDCRIQVDLRTVEKEAIAITDALNKERFPELACHAGTGNVEKEAESDVEPAAAAAVVPALAESWLHVQHDDRARLYDSVPDGPRRIKTKFKTENGMYFERDTVSKRYVTVTESCPAKWSEVVERVVSDANTGEVLQRAKIVHPGGKSSFNKEKKETPVDKTQVLVNCPACRARLEGRPVKAAHSHLPGDCLKAAAKKAKKLKPVKPGIKGVYCCREVKESDGEDWKLVYGDDYELLNAEVQGGFRHTTTNFREISGIEHSVSTNTNKLLTICEGLSDWKNVASRETLDADTGEVLDRVKIIHRGQNHVDRDLYIRAVMEHSFKPSLWDSQQEMLDAATKLLGELDFKEKIKYSASKYWTKMEPFAKHCTRKCLEVNLQVGYSRFNPVKSEHWEAIVLSSAGLRKLHKNDVISKTDVVAQFIFDSPPDLTEEYTGSGQTEVSWGFIEKHNLVRFFAESSKREFDAIKALKVGRFMTMEAIDAEGITNKMRSRIVFTIKWTPGGQISRCKSRLVILGFEDQRLGMSGFKTDSPTCSRLSILSLMHTSVKMRWRCQSRDYASAFLQGDEFHLEGVDPVTGVDNRIVMLCPKINETLRAALGWPENSGFLLLKPIYGLCDAPKRWQSSLKRELESKGFVASPWDESCYILPASALGKGKKETKNGKTLSWEQANSQEIVGMVTIHVDDVLSTGSRAFEEHLSTVKFAHSGIESVNFYYTNLSLSQSSDFAAASLSCGHYKDTLQCIDIDAAKRMSKEELTKQFRSLVGKVNWYLKLSPHWLVSAAPHASVMHAPTLADVVKLNKTTRKIQESADVPIQIRCNYKDICTVVILCDCAVPSVSKSDKKKARAGYLIFLVDSAGNATLMDWKSFDLKRVATTVLQGETLAAMEATNAAFFCVQFFKSVGIKIHDKVLLLSDSDSLVKQVNSSCRSFNDKRATGLISQFRCRVVEDGLIVRHLPGDLQLSDALTKEKSTVFEQLCWAIQHAKLPFSTNI